MKTYLPNPTYVTVAPNEYVTKYSFNRNFEKLISNDIALINAMDENSQIETYNKNKTYEAGAYVFYKIHRSDTQFYILKSMVTPNTHLPTVRRDLNTGKMFVINSDWWHIVGIEDDIEKNYSPKDKADNYIQEKQIAFKENHELNPAWHPSGKLGFKESTLLYKTFDNIDENRKTIFYPYSIQSFVTDNSIYYGYMRKWDNGLLEYDLTFRLGYISSDSEGIDVISANNINVMPRNYNYLYFKNDSDFSIFNQGGEYFVNTNGMKQINLNKDMNAYSAQLRFIEPFKDLNYMIFTSGVKNVDTEAFNIKNEVIPEHDPRFILNGLELVGVQKDASFKTEAIVPSQVKNIRSDALADLDQIDDYEVQITMLSNSDLMNIEPYAFSYSPIHSINIPVNVRHIGSYAFNGCSMLSSLAIYVYEDPLLQVKIDQDAFYKADISEISIIYVASNSQSSNEQQISAKFLDNSYLNDIGITNRDVIVHIYQKNGKIKSVERSAMRFASFMSSARITANASATSMMYNKKMLMSASTLMKSTIPFDLTAIYIDENNVITGYDSSYAWPNTIDIDLALLTNPSPSAIAASALYDFSQMTSINIPSTILSIGDKCINTDTCYRIVLNDVSCQLNVDNAQEICAIYSDSLADQPIPKISATSQINSLYLSKSHIQRSISAEQINNLYIVSAQNIYESAFQSINTIYNCEFNQENVQLSCGSFLFNYSICSDIDENTNEIVRQYIKPHAYNIIMNGNDYYIDSYAFTGISNECLSIDISNNASKVLANAFASADANLVIVGATADKLDDDSLNDVDAYKISFSDWLNFNDLCLNVLTSSNDLNRLAIPKYTEIATQTDSWFVNESNGYSQIPSYLYVENDILISCNTNILANSNVNVINIPKTITAIADNAIYVSKDQSSLSAKIYKVIVPNTVSSLGDNAFANNVNLSTIEFESGISFSHIGENIVSGCTSLSEIRWKAE